MPTPNCKEAIQPDQCTMSQTIRFLGAHRAQAGKWYLKFKLTAVMSMPDGRDVVLAPRDVTVKADKQVGRRIRKRLNHAQK